MTDSIWVVSHGEYSDYSVMCVCDSKERAEEVRDAYNTGSSAYSKAEIEQLPFITTTPKRMTVHNITESIFDDGTTREYRYWTDTSWDFELDAELRRSPIYMRWVRAPMYHGKGGRLHISGEDKIKVEKVFSEIRARLLVDDEFRMRAVME